MGNCCSNSTVDTTGDIKTLDQAQLQARITPKQLMYLIKVQARIRGFLTRKKIRNMHYNAGMGQYINDPELQDYDNPKVQVSQLSAV